VGSLRNKLLLLPICLLLGYFANWLITPLLMIGGLYLCFEGAEKIYGLVVPHAHDAADTATPIDPVEHKERKVAGAIYTQAAVLAAVGVLITIAVYGVVAFIVKADDIGLHMAKAGSGTARVVGRGLVKGVPVFLQILTAVGTAAMLWVGGSIIVHGLNGLGLSTPEHVIEGASHFVTGVIGVAPAVVGWLTASSCRPCWASSLAPSS
jgi:predicted DNA repair protein MutK